MYDYVIVGGGSAGCVLAARLSEDPTVRVCLIEAGPTDSNENIHIPAACPMLFRTALDWDYDTHEEPNAGARRIYLPRGRVLGGTGSINGMVYSRGNPADYDAWGLPGWGFADLLPYFKRSEDNERGASALHGVGGPLAVSDNRSRNPMSEAFIEAATEAGFAANDDFNGEQQDGFGYYQVTQRDGRRCTAATGYLHPVMDRANLTVETNLQVHRVLFEGNRAVGIVGRRLDDEITIRADREVILSAGAYNTPQLLMLSGIGPAQQLAPLGIPVLVDQPEVGRNLQDHTHTFLVFTHSQPVSLLAAGQPESVKLFIEEQRGPLTSNIPEAGGFVRSQGTLAAPDLQFHAAPVMFVDGGLGVPTEHGFSFGTDFLRPRSRGQVTLAGADPTAKPRIQHNYYADERDLQGEVEGLRIGLEISRQKALRPFTERAYLPPASESDADLRAHVRRYAQTAYHGASSCAMGVVVDTELRVRGVEGLRVVDASVLPTVFSNPNAPTIAVAEKASDLILGRTLLPAEAAAVAVG